MVEYSFCSALGLMVAKFTGCSTLEMCLGEPALHKLVALAPLCAAHRPAEVAGAQEKKLHLPLAASA